MNHALRSLATPLTAANGNGVTQTRTLDAFGNE